jgi:hypothetical protein
MRRPRVTRRKGKRPLQDGNDFAAMALRRHTVVFPVVPGLKVHHRVGVKDQDFNVVRPGCGDFSDRPRPGRVELGALRHRIGTVAGAQRLYQRRFAGADGAGQGPRTLDGLPGGADIGIVHAVVDVGAQCEGLAPPAHGAPGIERAGMGEGSARFCVVEAPGEAQSLIEIGLCFGAFGGDGHADRVAQAGIERRGVRRLVIGEPGSVAKAGAKQLLSTRRVGIVAGGRQGSREGDAGEECATKCLDDHFVSHDWMPAIAGRVAGIGVGASAAFARPRPGDERPCAQRVHRYQEGGVRRTCWRAAIAATMSPYVRPMSWSRRSSRASNSR